MIASVLALHSKTPAPERCRYCEPRHPTETSPTLEGQPDNADATFLLKPQGGSLFPVLRRHGEGLALGYAFGRLLEAAVITLGIIAVLALVTLRDAGAADGADVALAAVHDWAFLLGPNIALGLNTVLLAYLAYHARLVPRFIAVLGLVGGPLTSPQPLPCCSGLTRSSSVPGSAAALPVFASKLALAGVVADRQGSGARLRHRAPGRPRSG
ncbi:DUF4386 domain-containing protein [Streptomyces sp. NBC_00306]|uniref:DUF4386 domain-containing protein n=1 Tax=Streptomyces sp. NBC_00306 TaxID=2975708 RepID=UPI002E2ACFBA|nr:DUF4386 domain-containing protein [Streptomyces sp. NBC_00306]